MKLAENIARLRKARGMTQEALAERIGVSGQTISKWENANTWPDVAMLPLLADVFSVSIDALYGRETSYPDVSPQTAVDEVIKCVQEIIVAAIHDHELDGTLDDHLAQYKKAMQHEKHRSVIQNNRDVLYFREKIGALALRKPEAGWSSLFLQQENLEILRLLSDGDFRRAMQVIISRRMLNFTTPSLAKAAGVTDAARLEKMLQSSGLFARRELQIDEQMLTYYELVQGETKLYLLYAVLMCVSGMMLIFLGLIGKRNQI